MGDETQYFLRVEITLLDEQLSAAIERIYRLKMRAIQKNEQLSLTKVAALEQTLRLFQTRLRKLKEPEAAPSQVAVRGGLLPAQRRGK